MKPRDKTAGKLREAYDELGEIDSVANRKELREARRKAKHHMVKHNRNQEKRQLREALYRSDEE